MGDRKKSEGWRDCLSVDDQARMFVARYDERAATMQGVFDQALKVTQELLSRIEREMFRGLQYQAQTDQTITLFDAALTKSAEGLGKLVAQLATIHLRIAKDGEKKAREMSLEEQIELCVKFIDGLPSTFRNSVMKTLNE